jgi:hypothetical protein
VARRDSETTIVHIKHALRMAGKSLDLVSALSDEAIMMRSGVDRNKDKSSLVFKNRDLTKTSLYHLKWEHIFACATCTKVASFDVMPLVS